MDFKTFLENTAIAKGWRFIHARRDYQNLTDVLEFFNQELESFEDNETGIFLDPVTTQREADGIRYTGSFMVLTHADLDMPYAEKYDKFIVPAKEFVNQELWNKMKCDFDVTTWTTIEVINIHDFNGDGVSVQFNLKGY
ncbi:hypothetical protein [Leeuwenhoekiella nanhaiensis]|uniref:Uncharacterized protein n=1 Tax=Leeuwenhoekiella nanhaiensis TaxID=1655491 RepID=A0A2G1VN00_9FLAO|nr:hypothetical protein [Leeuwenhoekiella nanhaiensis]PHQ27859.1 hypothetical protein CJ305_17800 [Leeuwenhoekiella nanhaiensis]